MKKDFKPHITNVAEICARKQILNVVISSGSRSAPLTLAFLRHPKLKCTNMVDERSAGYIALGMAQQLERPVALVCTSGTAALNYAPAVAEAFYQHIPLLIFTADRPPEWIDQNDNQTIQQAHLYGKHVRGSFELPVEARHPDAKWHAERIISEAINQTVWPTPGPVHLNVPLREPLYPEAEIRYGKDCKLIDLIPAHNTLAESTWAELTRVWKSAARKLIVAGMHKPEEGLNKALQAIQEHDTASVVFDITSNLHGLRVQHSDMILADTDESLLTHLAPDLLLTFGGPVVSKSLKLFLRKYRPKQHWHITPDGQCIDTFQSLTNIVPVSAHYFFTQLAAVAKEVRVPGSQSTNQTYRGLWHKQELRAGRALQQFFKDSPHCELSATRTVLNALPEESRLQLGNSFIVRMANLIGLPDAKRVKVNSNRGTSGIDGTVSTAVGAAMTTEKLTTLIVGDLAFFYDRNALWHDRVPPNLRMVIINNGGGGIFRILPGARDLPELETYFEMAHHLSAERTALDHGLIYHQCGSQEALEKELMSFFEPKDRAAILEIHTDKQVNAKTYSHFKSMMREGK